MRIRSSLRILRNSQSPYRGGQALSERPESHYQSFLLRLWRTGEGRVCRVMLEHVDSHERHGFADVEALCTFLRQQARASTEEQDAIER